MRASGDWALGVLVSVGLMACGNTGSSGSAGGGNVAPQAGATSSAGKGSFSAGGAGGSGGGALGGSGGTSLTSAGSEPGGSGGDSGSAWQAPYPEDFCGTDGKCVHSLTQQWGGSRTKFATALAFDSKGNLYATCDTNVGNLPRLNELVGYFDVGVTRWTPQMKLDWAMNSGSPGYDRLLDARLGPQDELVLLGTFGGKSTSDPEIPTTWTISQQGIQDPQAVTWTTGDDDEQPLLARRTPSGALVTVGDYAVEGEDRNLFARHEAEGSAPWTQRWGTTGRDLISSLTFDPADNVYVAGTTTGAMPDAHSGGGTDAFLAKLDAKGTLVWVKQWGGKLEESVAGLVIVGEHLYLGGRTPRDSTETFPKLNAYISQFDLDGNLVWTKELPAQQDSVSVQLTAAANGRVYMVFESNNPELPLNRGIATYYPADMYLTEWNEAGDVRWLYRWGSPEGGFATSIASFENRIAVGGRSGPVPTFTTDDGAFLSVVTVDP